MRRLRLKHRKVKVKERTGGTGEREVVQFQYTAWPDHDTPTNILQLLSFIKKSSAATQVSLGKPNIFSCIRQLINSFVSHICLC